MKYEEFTEWLGMAQTAFPNLGTWINGLPDAPKTMGIWCKTLEATDPKTAAAVVLEWHRTGERPVKWEDWPWAVRNEAYQMDRGKVKEQEPEPPRMPEQFPERLKHVLRLFVRIGQAKHRIAEERASTPTDRLEQFEADAAHRLDKQVDLYKREALKAAGL